MNIFGIGLPEMAVIAAIALLVFGPKRLPEIGKTLGRTLKGVQSASQEFEKEFRSALRTEEDSSMAMVPPAIPASPEVDSSASSSMAAAAGVSEGGTTPSSPPQP
ncbi:MAG: TatA/E family twin arginine-targeting protein translocase [Cyanobium sp.]